MKKTRVSNLKKMKDYRAYERFRRQQQRQRKRSAENRESGRIAACKKRNKLKSGKRNVHKKKEINHLKLKVMMFINQKQKSQKKT